MEITGKVIDITPTVSGKTKTGDSWIKQFVAIDTGEQYDSLIAFEVFGNSRCADVENNLQIGDNVTVSFNIKCRKNDDNYYTNLSAWRFQK